MSERSTTLLNLLASIPPEHLVEGARIDVTTTSGETVAITLGPRSPVDTLLERDSIAVAHDPQHTPAARALVDLVDPPPAGMVGRILEHVRRLHTNGDHK